MLSLSRAAPVRLASPPQLPLHMTRRPCSPELALYLTLHLFMRLSGSGGKRVSGGGVILSWPAPFFI